MHRERLKILSPERQIVRQSNNLEISHSFVISLFFAAVSPKISTVRIDLVTCKDICWDSPLLNAQEPKSMLTDYQMKRLFQELLLFLFLHIFVAIDLNDSTVHITLE